MYQAVFFDAFNTLFRLQWRQQERTPTRLPLQQTAKRWSHGLDAHLQAVYGRARSSDGDGTGVLGRVFAAVADWTGYARSGPLVLLRRNEETVRRWFKVYADTVSTLQALNELCRLGIITNAWPYLEPLLRTLGIWDYFHSVIISAQVGLSKPNPAIYELALRHLRVGAHEALFIDDLAANVLAAERSGLTGLWLVRTPAKASSIQPAYRGLTQISSLDEVMPFVFRAPGHGQA